MRILYIYRDYKGRRKMYIDVMKKCGHTVKQKIILEKKIANQVKPKHIKEHKPDILFFYMTHYLTHKVISNETINYLKEKKIPIILYSTYVPDIPYNKQLKYWEKLDLLFIEDRKFHDYLKKCGLKSYYIPIGFHPQYYYKTLSSDKDYDISFMGSPLKQAYDKRTLYLQYLINKKFRIGVFGKRFKNTIKNYKVKSFGNHELQRITYSKTKINLDFPFIDGCDFYRDKYHIKNRFFEIPATCNFLLTVRCPEFLEIFDEDTVGYYDDNIESLREEVSRYLKDKKLREKMSEKAYKLVHEKHTFLHRFKEMFKIMEREL